MLLLSLSGPLRLRDSMERPGIIFSPKLPQASIPWLPMRSWRASPHTTQDTLQLPAEYAICFMTHVRKTDRLSRPPFGLLTPFIKTGFCGLHLTKHQWQEWGAITSEFTLEVKTISSSKGKEWTKLEFHEQIRRGGSWCWIGVTLTSSHGCCERNTC